MPLIIFFVGTVMLLAYFLPLFTAFAQFETSRTGGSSFETSRIATELQNPIGFNSLRALVVAILDVIVQVAVPLAALFLIYSGYLFVSARGNEEALNKAKSIFMWTIVGIAVLLGAKVLSGIIEGTIEQIKR